MLKLLVFSLGMFLCFSPLAFHFILLFCAHIQGKLRKKKFLSWHAVWPIIHNLLNWKFKSFLSCIISYIHKLLFVEAFWLIPCVLHSDEAAGTSEDELSCGKVEAVEYSGMRQGDQELKEMLLRKYGGYLSSLRKEFLKKRKKGKLPKDARKTLTDWWNTHYRWPYPTVIEINIT